MHKGKIYRHERSLGPTVPFTNVERHKWKYSVGDEVLRA
jgi:hypothetical protein